jgi:hypothetical protein
VSQDTKKPKNGNSPRVIFSELPPSKEKLIQRGIDAANLLMSPVYGIAHQSVIQNIQDEWLESEPHEQQKREGLYWKACALSAVSLKMAAMIQEAQALDEETVKREEMNANFE